MKETLKDKTGQTISAVRMVRNNIGALLSGRSFASLHAETGKRIALFPRRRKRPAVKVPESEKSDLG
jgi:hypothetical protein